MIVPVIVVFTKYDLLVAHEERLLKQADHSEKSKEEFARLIEQSTKADLQDICIKPFEEFVNGNIPYITVSSMPKATCYNQSIDLLLQWNLGTSIACLRCLT